MNLDEEKAGYAAGVLAVIAGVLLSLQLRPYGPEWIWTGCMDPGPGVEGCAGVFPIGIVGVVLLVGATVLTVAYVYHRVDSRGSSNGGVNED